MFWDAFQSLCYNFILQEKVTNDEQQTIRGKKKKKNIAERFQQHIQKRQKK